MISSIFALKEDNIIPQNLASVEETKFEENYYFNSSLDFLLETHEELLQYRQDFYKSIMLQEEVDMDVVNESFSDIIAKVKEIIKKILAYIESLIKRFVTHLAKFVKSDKYLIKMKDNIRKVPSDETFDYDGFTYTMEDKPVVDVVGLDLAQLKDQLRLIDDNKDIAKKIDELNNLVKQISDVSTIDVARGQILGLDNPITDSSFADQLFCAFRDGSSTSTLMTINREYVLQANSRYADYKSKIKEVKALQNSIKSKYTTLQNQISDAVHSNISIEGESKINTKVNNQTYTTEYKTNLSYALNKLVEAQVNQIEKIANLHVQAVAAKLDAYNSLVIQDRAILYKALLIAQRDIKNSKFMKESLDLTVEPTSYDYTLESTYKSFIYEKYFMNKRQEQFVKECLCLEGNNIPELQTIQEDLKMNVKNKFEKLIAFMKELFQKFLMKMNKLFTNDKEFMKKYKDIILTKKVEEYTLNDMPDYEAGIKNIKGHKLPALDIKNMLSETETGVQQKVLPGYDGNGDFVDFTKNYFMSDNKPAQKEVKSTTLNMKDLYDFCLNANESVKAIQSDLDKYTKAAKDAESFIASNRPKNESTMDITGRKYYYSSILEEYIEEFGFGKKTGNSTNNSASATPTITDNSDSKSSTDNANNNTAKLKLTPENPDHDNSNKNENLKDDVKSDSEAKKDETQDKENKNTDIKKIEETATWYLNSIKTVCTAKMTALQKIYSEYMKILRYHVKKATGSLGKASNLTEDDQKQIRDVMQDYFKETDQKKKEEIADRLISIYKSRDMVIDRHDAINIIEKNKSAFVKG